MILQDTQPNGWAALIALIGMIGAIATNVVTYLLTRRGQDPKLDKIHEVANGRLDAALKKIDELQAENAALKARLGGR